MQKTALATLAAMALTGCTSTALNTKSVSEYEYESRAHTGTVHVTDTVLDSRAKECNVEWREGELYRPSGFDRSAHQTLDVSVLVSTSASDDETKMVLNVPFSLGSKVLARDAQKWQGYMLSPETDGIVSQGDYFEFPEGYYFRASEPAIEGNMFKLCLGIDHMYAIDSDLNAGVEPPIYLDRISIPVAVEGRDGAVKVSFGSQTQHNVEIRIKPR